MTREEIENRVISIIHEQKTIPENTLGRTTPLSEAGIDSLDALNILFALEETFQIAIADDRARQIRTLDDMVNTISELLAVTKV